MNLWRVPIEETTGRILGEPEPLTTPSTWTGRFSLSRDGTRLAFATLDFRSTLLRAPFDPVKETLTGPPVPMLKGTRPIRDHQLSPDGRVDRLHAKPAHRRICSSPESMAASTGG